MSEAMYLDMSQMPPVVKKSFGQYLKERNPKLYEVFGTDEAAYANYYDKTLHICVPTCAATNLS